MKRILSLCILAAMLVTSVIAFPACSKKTEGTLRVGMECNYPPFNWAQVDTSNGAVKINDDVMYAGGYDVEMAKKIAEGLNMDLEIVKLEWDSLLVALDSNVIDLVIAGMSPTEERKQTIDFSDPYYTSELILIVRKDGKYASATSLADFDGAAVVGQLGTVHDEVIDQIPNVIHKDAMGSFSEMRIALESGIVDAYVAEKPEGMSVTAANPNFTYIEFAEGKGFTVTEDQVAVSVGISKGNDERLAKINEILAGISEDDRVQMMADATANQPQG